MCKLAFVPFQKALEFRVCIELEIVHEPIDLPVAIIRMTVFLPISQVQLAAMAACTDKGLLRS
jgi:hypothetical protein